MFFCADAGYDALDIGRLSAVCGRTMVLLPGPVFLPAQADVCILYRESTAFDAAKNAGLFFADVRLLNRDDFTAFLAQYPVQAVLLPFAECAFVSEYGYRASYRMLAELRAVGFSFCTVAVFSAPGANDSRLQEVIGSRDAVLLKNDNASVFPAVSFETAEERDLFLAAECKKYADKQTVVLFPTRSGAQRFCTFLRGRGGSCHVFHGGYPAQTNANTVRDFWSGQVRTLAATKYLLPSALFFRTDRVLYAGLPFSPAHAQRCAFLSKQNSVTVCFAQSDFALSQALSQDFADAVGADTADFLAFRQEKQRALLGRLMF